jgi:hypothetical protein
LKAVTSPRTPKELAEEAWIEVKPQLASVLKAVTSWISTASGNSEARESLHAVEVEIVRHRA